MEETVKEKQVKTDNELIAEFMGLKSREVLPLEHRHTVWYKDDPEQWFSFPDYKTWNSLMPVVEKIENGLAWKYRVITENELYLPVETVEYRTTINDAGNSVLFEMPACSSRIESVYKAVVEFIKWYNTQTLPL